VETGILTRAVIYHWPPGSWDDWSLARFARFLQAESDVNESRQPPATPVESAESGDDG